MRIAGAPAEKRNNSTLKKKTRARMKKLLGKNPAVTGEGRCGEEKGKKETGQLLGEAGPGRHRRKRASIISL